MRLRWRQPLLTMAAIASFSTLSACGAFSYSPTPLPSEPPAQQSAPSSPASTAACRENPLASYAPGGPLPTPETLPGGSTMARIQKRGRLVAGVSADTYLLGSRDPFTGEIEGFDIDMVKAVAKAIFGNENRYQLKVITAAQRIPALENRAEQKVCAPIGTSSMDNLIKKAPKAIPVGADTHTGCLVLFQQGQVAAITGDDTVLAGLVAQDPYAVVPNQRAFTEEPYGLGFNEKDVDFVRFVNARLDEMRTNGEWTRIYNRWLRGSLGPAPEPPIPVYGRTR